VFFVGNIKKKKTMLGLDLIQDFFKSLLTPAENPRHFHLLWKFNHLVGLAYFSVGMVLLVSGKTTPRCMIDVREWDATYVSETCDYRRLTITDPNLYLHMTPAEAVKIRVADKPTKQLGYLTLIPWLLLMTGLLPLLPKALYLNSETGVLASFTDWLEVNTRDTAHFERSEEMRRALTTKLVNKFRDVRHSCRGYAANYFTHEVIMVLMTVTQSVVYVVAMGEWMILYAYHVAKLVIDREYFDVADAIFPKGKHMHDRLSIACTITNISNL